MTTSQVLAPPPPALRLRAARYEPEPGTGSPTLPRLVVPPARPPVSAAEVADAHRRIVPVLRIALEVLDGRRPTTHLGGHASAPVLRYWRAACGQRQVRTPAQLRALRVCLPAPSVAEVAAVCAIDGRVRALAARFERSRHGGGAWSCTAVRLG